MQSTSCKMPGWMKQKLESRLPGEISITSDTRMAESEEQVKSLLVKVQEEREKVGSKLNIQKTTLIFPHTGVFSNSIGVSASLLMRYSWLISFKTDWISLLSKVLSRVFSSTTVQKHQFFSAHPLCCRPHIHA